MDELWRDINPSLLLLHRPPDPPATATFRSLLLQDFLSPPPPSSAPKRAPLESPVVDRHRKRMIKNRESAARSRARKQAYVTELESEVERLIAENAFLRDQHQLQEQILQDPIANQAPNKHGLQRTSSAPNLRGV